jgi:ABC-type polysaccharide/polyol phosphate export permease
MGRGSALTSPGTTVAGARRDARPRTIQPAKRLVLPSPRELWAYRDLFWFLVWRDIKLRAAQTRIGIGWIVLQPLAMLGVYTFAFSRLGHTAAGIPYPLFALAGLTAWQFISRAILQGAESLVAQVNVIKRTGSPRILFPLAAIASGGIDFGVSLALYLVFAAAYGRTPGWHVVAVVPLLALSAALATGFALLLAPAHARYRDVGRLLPFVVQLWFFVSPVAYALPRLGGRAHVIESLNPLVGVLSGFRWALVGSPLEPRRLLLAVGVSIVTIVLGIVYFDYAQQTVADDL